MKTSHGIGLGALVTFLSAGAWLGCGGDDTLSNPTLDGGGGMDSTVDTGTRDTGTDTGNKDTGQQDMGTQDMGTQDMGAGDSGDGGGGEGGTLDCTTYCTGVLATCTGANAQYNTAGTNGGIDECMNACSFFPPGTLQDTSGNTLGCRIYHTGLAATGMKNPHCWHAGPFGYDGCGSACEGFCNLAVGWCSSDAGFGGTPPYADLATCTTDCMAYTSLGPGADGGYTGAGPTGGPTLDCREYHMGASLDNPDSGDQALHCQHVGQTSPTCN